MITLIYGGSGSGKSEYAEKTVMDCSEPGSRYYIATMHAYGEEGLERIQRHRELRSGKGFQTIECPVDIGSALEHIPDPSKATVLLECVSNLLANEMFDRQTEDGFDGGASARVMNGLSLLCSSVKNVIIVTNNIFEDGTAYDELTVKYMDSLGMVNAQLALMADRVTEVVAGIPVPLFSSGLNRE